MTSALGQVEASDLILTSLTCISFSLKPVLLGWGSGVGGRKIREGIGGGGS